MTRVNLLLMLAILASAIYLVRVQYDSRRLFTELDRAQADQRRLQTEYERLQVEKRAQATPSRVEKLAREKLQMRQAGPAITAYVNYSAPETFTTESGMHSNAGTGAAAPAGARP